MMTKDRFGLIQPWVSLVMRVAAGLIMIVAGVLKLADLDMSVYAVRSYDILPQVLVTPAGYALPFVEVALGFFLVLGLLTRWVAVFYLLLFAAFIFGTLWVQARGLEISCGCFGGGGPVPKADYFGHLRDQAFFTSLGVWLVFFPKSPFSVDGWLRPTQ